MHECSIEREVMKNAGIKRIDTYRDLLNELNITIINDRETIKLLREQNEKLKEQLSSAQPEPHWISCDERLPEKEGWYITTVESEKTGRRRIENDLFAVDIALAHGHTPNKFCKDGYKQRTVAWMPFPEPWKGEQHG